MRLHGQIEKREGVWKGILILLICGAICTPISLYIMDYPPKNSIGDNATKYYNTWYWQWKVIWEEVRRHN